MYENVIKAKDDIANAIKETYENGSFSLMSIANLENATVDNSKVDEVVLDRLMIKSIYSKLDAIEDSIRMFSNTPNVSDELNVDLNNRKFASLLMECRYALRNQPDNLDLLISCYQKLLRVNSLFINNKDNKLLTPKDCLMLRNTLAELNDRINDLTLNTD